VAAQLSGEVPELAEETIDAFRGLEASRF